VVEDGLVLAAGFFKSVGKDSEACGVEFAGWQGTLFVGGCGKAGHVRRPPGGVEGDGAEGVAGIA
jgi:hypothetical protein